MKVSHSNSAVTAARNEALENVAWTLVAAKLFDAYDDWAPQWGEHRNMAVAQKAAEDCAAKIRELIGK